jgi:hypothetical protein
MENTCQSPPLISLPEKKYHSKNYFTKGDVVVLEFDKAGVRYELWHSPFHLNSFIGVEINPEKQSCMRP